MKAFQEIDMEKNVKEKIAENLDSVEHGNFIRGSRASAVRGCPGIDLVENVHDRVLL